MDLDGSGFILKNNLKYASVKDKFHMAYAYYNWRRSIKIANEIIKK
jgi:hypothetical protein